MDLPPIGDTLRKAISQLPQSDASLSELIAFSRSNDPVKEFQKLWGSAYKDSIEELWSSSTHSFKERRPIGATPDELLLCMAFDVTVAPYIGVPEDISHAYLHYVLKELREKLDMSDQKTEIHEDLNHQKEQAEANKRNKNVESENLREQLFKLTSSGKEKAFGKLCSENRTTILENFRNWKNVPESLHTDQNAVSLYATGLISVARWFEANGDSQLIKLLQENNNSNPIVVWEKRFGDAEKCKLSGQYVEAIKILEQLVQDMKKCKGTAVDQYLPMIYGALGENYLHSNQCGDAYDITRKAFEECQRIGDMEGIIAYCGNLSEICKRLGKNDDAKKWLIITSNIMIQIGQSENAAQLRSSIGIEPTSELITVRNFPD